MKFSEKLTYLMQVTATTNKILANEIMVDPSLISKMKNGSRGVPKNADYIECMSHYFSSKFPEEKLKEIYKMFREDEICFTYAFENLSENIFIWLSDNKSQNKNLRHTLKTYNDNTNEQKNDGITVYLGNEGKRRAYLDFFDIVSSQSEKGKVYICSDENYTWAMEERKFEEELYRRMENSVLKGFEYIRILTYPGHTERAMDEIMRWMPLYAAGAVGIYTYPRLRDMLYRRSYCILPSVCALISSSIGEFNTESRVTYLIHDKVIVKAYEEEFKEYMNLCTPAMNEYTTRNMKSILSILKEFECVKKNGIHYSSSLPMLSITDNIWKRIRKRATEKNINDVEAMYECYKVRTQKACEIVRGNNKIFDIFSLASAKDIIAGKIVIPISVMTGNKMYYTADEYREELEFIYKCIEKYKNYIPTIVSKNRFHSMVVYVKEGYEVLIISSERSFAVMELNDNISVITFWEYLSRFCDRSEDAIREETKKKIEYLIKEIENMK